MTAVIPLNPYKTSVSNNGLFSVSTTGLRQGTAYPDPATRFSLRTGILAAAETIPMWGGVGVYEYVPNPGPPTLPSYTLGPSVGRATSLTGSKALRGWSTYDQAYGMVTSPSSPAPLIGSYGQVMTYQLGSRVRLAVACDPILIDLRGGDIGGPSSTPNLVSWDFTNQLLIPYEGTLTVSSGTYNNTTGVITLVMSANVTFGPGDSMTLASLTGTGAFASLDGTWTVLTAALTAVTLQGPIGVGASTITGGSATIGGAAGQPLPVALLDIQSTNCEIVEYDSVNNVATWNFNGACAVIQI